MWGEEGIRSSGSSQVGRKLAVAFTFPWALLCLPEHVCSFPASGDMWRAYLVGLLLPCLFQSLPTEPLADPLLGTTAQASKPQAFCVPFILGVVLSDSAIKHGCVFFFFWPYWVFVALCGLSLIAASGGYSLLRCTGFSLQWLLLWSTELGSWASVVAALRLSSWGWWAQ